MKQKKVLTLLIIFSLCFPVAVAQEDVIPFSLEVKVYQDGSALVKYNVESDPTKVRVDIDLIGETFNNLVIRNEDGLPLDFTRRDTGVTVDSIGALELRIVYTTSDLTSKEGPIWNISLTSPISTVIILPENAGLFGMSDIPLDVGTINGNQYIELPAGDLYLSFILSAPNLRGEAQEAINEAEDYLSNLESLGYILTDAREELSQARQLYEDDQFSDAMVLVTRSKETADKTVNLAEVAEADIAQAEINIEKARDEGRIIGLEQAEETLSSAESYYLQGLYVEASTAAKQANQIALSSETQRRVNPLLYLGLIVPISVIVVGFYYLSRLFKLRANLPDNSKKVNLEKIFDKQPDLRLEDREVIKFMAETNGEAFAAEIRDRFDMPRSSAWRLIRRLVSLEIAEEVKVGNQSLVKIKEEYLE